MEEDEERTRWVELQVVEPVMHVVCEPLVRLVLSRPGNRDDQLVLSRREIHCIDPR